jgi:hypothetical protein
MHPITQTMTNSTQFTEQDLLSFFASHEEGLTNAWRSTGGEAPNEADYQRPSDGISKMLFPSYQVFRHRSVLDMGCNSGLNSLAIALLARKVTACDTVDVYIRRALAGLEYIQHYAQVTNLSFHVGDFSSFLSEDIDAIVAGRILYHIGNTNVLRLGAFISQQDEFVAVIHTRPGRPASRTTLYNGLIEVADVVNFLRDCGMTVEKQFGSATQKVIVALKTPTNAAL